MEKILILGTDSTTKEVLRVCRERQLHTVITDYLTPDQSPLKREADEYWMINVTEIDLLEAKCHEEGITAVFAGNHELCLDCAQALTRRLGLPFYASDLSWRASRDKILFKKLCQECGIATALSYGMEEAMDPESLQRVEYPVVIKPADSSSGRGVTIVWEESEFASAYEYAMSYSPTKHVIVEEYLTGDQFQVNGYAQDGEITFFLYYHFLDHEFEGRKVLGPLLPYHNRTYLTDEFLAGLRRLAARMEIQNGMFFFQGICQNGEPRLIETACRLEGFASWSFAREIYHFDIVGNMVNLARGIVSSCDIKKLNLDPCGRDQYFTFYPIWVKPGVISQVIGEKEVFSSPGIENSLQRFRPGMVVNPVYNLTQVGWYIHIIASSAEELCGKMRFINRTLQILDEDGRNLCSYFENYEKLREKES